MATPNEDAVAPIPNLELAQYAFTLAQPSQSEKHAEARAALLKGIEEDGELPVLLLASPLSHWHHSMTAR